MFGFAGDRAGVTADALAVVDDKTIVHINFSLFSRLTLKIGDYPNCRFFRTVFCFVARAYYAERRFVNTLNLLIFQLGNDRLELFELFDGHIFNHLAQI